MKHVAPALEWHSSNCRELVDACSSSSLCVEMEPYKLDVIHLLHMVCHIGLLLH
jgi:hypothetical protein